jgi:hypothetical protein
VAAYLAQQPPLKPVRTDSHSPTQGVYLCPGAAAFGMAFEKFLPSALPHSLRYIAPSLRLPRVVGTCSAQACPSFFSVIHGRSRHFCDLMAHAMAGAWRAVPFQEILSVQQLDPVWRGAMQCARIKASIAPLFMQWPPIAQPLFFHACMHTFYIYVCRLACPALLVPLYCLCLMHKVAAVQLDATATIA